MELCSGGDLYSRDPYTEEQAARIVSSILSAIAYMHSRNIAHRDLKYENILFVNDSPSAEVKLIDFGLSKVYGDDLQLTEGVGTIYTMAPEVLKGDYSPKADIWSIGVITYMLLSSQMPFYGRKRRHIVEQILNGQYDFRGRRWKRISEQAKNFIDDLLVLDPEERSDAPTALSCTWLNKRFAATVRGPQVEEETMARQAMLRYAGYTKLKKMALMVVAHKSTCDEIGILRKVFQKYDKKNDGCITYEQFCEALKESGNTTEDMKNMFDAVVRFVLCCVCVCVCVCVFLLRRPVGRDVLGKFSIRSAGICVNVVYRTFSRNYCLSPGP
jgi:serine/threonine protein kinase